jgi:hypothetical protein
MQHHDGITATSKTHIERGFKLKMKDKSNEIIDHIQKIHNTANTFVCRLYETRNECELPLSLSSASTLTFNILAHGGPRS